MALESGAGGPECELLANCSVYSVVSEDKSAGVLCRCLQKFCKQLNYDNLSLSNFLHYTKDLFFSEINFCM